MGDTWLKIKAWTKGIFFGAVLIYVVLFVFKNSGDTIRFWWWFGYSKEIDAIFLALVSFVAGALCAFLIGTTWRTVRQIRDVRDGRRADREERERADVRAKAALLHTAPAAAVPTPAAEGVTVRVDNLGTGT